MWDCNCPEYIKNFSGVSCETVERLVEYCELLQKWQRKINLVSRDVSDIWSRHVFDSLQLIPHIPANDSVCDIGSGGGFPGVILAVAGVTPLTMIESNGKKCTFLREATRRLPSDVRILNQRIEDCPPLNVDIVTARALASLEVLLGFANKLLKPNGKCLFLKGYNVDIEIEIASKSYDFKATKIKSQSSEGGVILQVEDIHPKG